MSSNNLLFKNNLKNRSAMAQLRPTEAEKVIQILYVLNN